MNLFIPTSAVVMGGLAIARVPYGTYLQWVWPLLAMLAALTVVVLAVGGARLSVADGGEHRTGRCTPPFRSVLAAVHECDTRRRPREVAHGLRHEDLARRRQCPEPTHEK